MSETVGRPRDMVLSFCIGVTAIALFEGALRAADKQGMYEGSSIPATITEPVAAADAVIGALLALPDLSGLLPLGPWTMTLIALQGTMMAAVLIVISVVVLTLELLRPVLEPLYYAMKGDSR